ncbi:ABC transporter permease [Paucibacter sp. APW11]|uniref:ABC transporter permease n=1 Tax=Roseateles aquae TaxID=3077235 RepID=A0ABU3PIC3_9BURK|nr:ABC transporter permease [Paucibacter sp. APW11]MDT9002112.1 ABC transporter permease [Paucibacter sp. APW11]
MKYGDFRMGWRVMRKQPAFSAVMVLGLAIGFAVTFLVLGFLHFEASFDRHVPKAEQVYVLKARANWGLSFWSENVPLSMKEAIASSGAPVQATAVLPYSVSVRVGARSSELELTLVDPDFDQVFGIKAEQGDLRAALSRPDAISLTRESAQKLFGTADALGQRVQVRGQSFEVLAIVARPPEASSVRYEALVGIGTALWPEQERVRARAPWNYYSEQPTEWPTCKVYVRAPSAGLLAQLEQRIVADIETSAMRGHLGEKDRAELGTNKLIEVKLGPLLDSYLDPQARSNSGPKGDRLANFALLFVALLILVLTVGNYVNLATIRTVQRQREMAVRKVLGIGTRRLIAQMLTESILVSLLAALLGAGIAGLMLPSWSDMTSHPIAQLMGTGDWIVFALVVLAGGIIVGLCSGLYPLWVVQKMQAAQALAGRGGSESGGGLWLRRVLTVLQFGIAIFVSAMVVTISWQINYLKRIDYGYAVDSLLAVTVPKELSATQLQSFKNALQARPEIAAVAGSELAPTRRELSLPGAAPVVLDQQRVSPEYFATLGLAVQAGRAFDAGIDAAETAKVAIVDPQAALRLGHADAQAAVGKFVDLGAGQGPLQIVGVSRREGSGFRQAADQAVVYTIGVEPTLLMVRAGQDIEAARGAVEALASELFPDQFFSVRKQRTRLELNAGGPMVILQICLIVAAVIVPLSVFSVYILSAFTVQKRAREIVVRKLHGASRADIARLLARQFVWLLAIAALPALPAAYLFGQMFLQQFAEQAAIGAWATLIALLGALVVTLIAALRHTLVAMRMAPADVLRAA